LLAADGVSLDLASIGHEKTTIAIADVDSEGFAEYEFLVQGTSAPNLTAEALPERLGSDVSAIYLGTLGLVLEPLASTLVELLRQERGGRLVMLDPNIRTGLIPDAEYRDRLRSVISQSTVVKASEADMAWLYPGLGEEKAAAQMLTEGVNLVVVTLGARGAFGVHRDFRVSVKAPEVDVVDTIGAGDAFGAALAAWLHDHALIGPEPRLERDQLQAALDYACLAAAITCARAGADPPWKWELISPPREGPRASSH
jgi:fructokinase